MFKLRVNQLKRSLSNYVSANEDGEIKSLAENILSTELEESGDPTSLHEIYEDLSNITILGQIFSRYISQLATEDPSPEMVYKIEALIKFGQLLRDELKKQDDFNRSYDEITNFIRGLKKNQNKKITNIDGMLQHCIENSKEMHSKLEQLHSWNELLDCVFDANIENGNTTSKSMEKINIKELLLMNAFSGNFTSQVYDKYDGLLTYTMSLLTMLSGTNYETEFKGKLERILESLGTSTQITLLSQRLLRKTKDWEFFKEEYTRLRNEFNSKIETHQISVSEFELKQIFAHFQDHLEFQLNCEEPHLEQISFNPQLSGALFASLRTDLQKSYQRNCELRDEFYATLKDLDDFLGSVIKNANLITSDLFSQGFRASIPLHDIEKCEKAGLHLRNITATSSTQKVQLDEGSYDMKLKLLRRFETLWKDLEIILKVKVNEETLINNINHDLKLFNELFSTLVEKITQWKVERVFSGAPEENIMACRTLYSAFILLEDIYVEIAPFKKTPLGSENLSQFLPTLAKISQIFVDIKKLDEIVQILNQMAKILWTLNRAYVIEIFEDPSYIQAPQTILNLVAEIPRILKQETMQKLITKDERNKKMENYNNFTQLVEKLKNHDLQARLLLIPYKNIDL